jgi:HK97 gp10 family phage protein
VKVRAKFEGREKVMARLRAIAPAAETELATAQLEAAQDLAGKIRSRAPRRTGRYAASIVGDRLTSRPGGNLLGGGLRGRTKDKNATGIFGEFIWRFLEFGTVKMARQPHVFPTFRAARKGIRRKMATAVNRALRKTKK